MYSSASNLSGVGGGAPAVMSLPLHGVAAAAAAGGGGGGGSGAGGGGLTCSTNNSSNPSACSTIDPRMTSSLEGALGREDGGGQYFVRGLHRGGPPGRLVPAAN